MITSLWWSLWGGCPFADKFLPKQGMQPTFCIFLRKRQLKKIAFWRATSVQVWQRRWRSGDPPGAQPGLAIYWVQPDWGGTAGRVRRSAVSPQHQQKQRLWFSGGWGARGHPCSKLLALFQEVHFWSIKWVLFLKLGPWGGGAGGYVIRAIKKTFFFFIGVLP